MAKNSENSSQHYWQLLQAMDSLEEKIQQGDEKSLSHLRQYLQAAVALPYYDMAQKREALVAEMQSQLMTEVEALTQEKHEEYQRQQPVTKDTAHEVFSSEDVKTPAQERPRSLFEVSAGVSPAALKEMLQENQSEPLGLIRKVERLTGQSIEALEASLAEERNAPLSYSLEVSPLAESGVYDPEFYAIPSYAENALSSQSLQSLKEMQEELEEYNTQMRFYQQASAQLQKTLEETAPGLVVGSTEEKETPRILQSLKQNPMLGQFLQGAEALKADVLDTQIPAIPTLERWDEKLTAAHKAAAIMEKTGEKSAEKRQDLTAFLLERGKQEYPSDSVLETIVGKALENNENRPFAQKLNMAYYAYYERENVLNRVVDQSVKAAEKHHGRDFPMERLAELSVPIGQEQAGLNLEMLPQAEREKHEAALVVRYTEAVKGSGDFWREWPKAMEVAREGLDEASITIADAKQRPVNKEAPQAKETMWAQQEKEQFRPVSLEGFEDMPKAKPVSKSVYLDGETNARKSNGAITSEAFEGEAAKQEELVKEREKVKGNVASNPNNAPPTSEIDKKETPIEKRPSQQSQEKDPLASRWTRFTRWVKNVGRYATTNLNKEEKLTDYFKAQLKEGVGEDSILAAIESQDESVVNARKHDAKQPVNSEEKIAAPVFEGKDRRQLSALRWHLKGKPPEEIEKAKRALTNAKEALKEGKIQGASDSNDRAPNTKTNQNEVTKF